MCGIAGFSWKNPPERNVRKALAITLGIYNDSRGGKGYGVFVQSRKPKFYKGPSTFAQFIARQGIEWALAKAGFIHTRWPTTGEPSALNSHPFKFGHIIGAHNGVISNHSELCKKYNRNFNVDSMHLFAHLAEERSFEDIEGYGAIEWYDSQDQKIRLTHFNSGSLSIQRIPNVGVIWSSDSTHLKEALEAAGLWLKSQEVKITEDLVYEIVDGEIYEGEKKTFGDRPYYGKGYSYTCSGEYSYGKSKYWDHTTKQWRDADSKKDESGNVNISTTKTPAITTGTTVIPHTEPNVDITAFDHAHEAFTFNEEGKLCSPSEAQSYGIAPTDNSPFFDWSGQPIRWEDIPEEDSLFDSDGAFIDQDEALATWEYLKSISDIEEYRDKRMQEIIAG